MSANKLGKKINLDEIDKKHNIHRLKKQLSWIYNDFDNINPLLNIYWFDNELKNICFPWILKFEREFKAGFIWLYKQEYKTSDSEFIMDKKMFNSKKCDSKRIDEIISKIDDILTDKKTSNIDELIFSFTFGEFITTLLNFNESFFDKFSNMFHFPQDIMSNILKYLNILRNSIAHNKSVIKIHDEKTNKRFSLKLNFFDFEISKEDADIISINSAGIIYVVNKLIKNSNSSKKENNFIKEIINILARLEKNINNDSVFESIMKKIFLSYKENILSIN